MDNSNSSQKTYPATIVKVVDGFTVAIDRGATDGVQLGQLFLIYSLGEELNDPVTGESLGRLEIVKGRGKVINVQERIATIESTKYGRSEKKTVKRQVPPASSSALYAYPFGHQLLIEEEIIEIPGQLLPFHDPQKGDKAKPI